MRRRSLLSESASRFAPLAPTPAWAKARILIIWSAASGQTLIARRFAQRQIACSHARPRPMLPSYRRNCMCACSLARHAPMSAPRTPPPTAIAPRARMPAAIVRNAAIGCSGRSRPPVCVRRRSRRSTRSHADFASWAGVDVRMGTRRSPPAPSPVTAVAPSWYSASWFTCQRS